MELIRSYVIDCAGKEGVSSADLSNILSKRPPTTYAGKCVGACVGETIGMVSHAADSFGNCFITKVLLLN